MPVVKEEEKKERRNKKKSSSINDDGYAKLMIYRVAASSVILIQIKIK